MLKINSNHEARYLCLNAQSKFRLREYIFSLLSVQGKQVLKHFYLKEKTTHTNIRDKNSIKNVSAHCNLKCVVCSLQLKIYIGHMFVNIQII